MIPLSSLRKKMEKMQEYNDQNENYECASAIDILTEELMEAEVAYREGNLGDCLNELYQLGGCVISAAKMVAAECVSKM